MTAGWPAALEAPSAAPPTALSDFRSLKLPPFFCLGVHGVLQQTVQSHTGSAHSRMSNREAGKGARQCDGMAGKIGAALRGPGQRRAAVQRASALLRRRRHAQVGREQAHAALHAVDRLEVRLPHRLSHQRVQLLHALRWSSSGVRVRACACVCGGSLLCVGKAEQMWYERPPQPAAAALQSTAQHPAAHTHTPPALLPLTWSYASCVMSTLRGSWLPLITTRTVSSALNPSKSVLRGRRGARDAWDGLVHGRRDRPRCVAVPAAAWQRQQERQLLHAVHTPPPRCLSQR